MKQSERPSYKLWYAKNRERIIAKSTARNRARSVEYRSAVQKRSYEKHKVRRAPERQAEARAAYWKDPIGKAAQAKRYRQALRLEFIAEYGGQCACCAEAEYAFLTLEHKRRDGKQHRSSVGTSTQVLADLKRRGWPKDNYELLCFNCNRASWEQGICPHRVKN